MFQQKEKRERILNYQCDGKQNIEIITNFRHVARSLIVKTAVELPARNAGN